MLLGIGIDWQFLKVIVAGNRYRLAPSLTMGKRHKKVYLSTFSQTKVTGT